VYLKIALRIALLFVLCGEVFEDCRGTAYGAVAFDPETSAFTAMSFTHVLVDGPGNCAIAMFASACLEKESVVAHLESVLTAGLTPTTTHPGVMNLSSFSSATPTHFSVS
jgi:hypothetical protein